MIKIGYTVAEVVQASSNEGLSWSRKPLRNQWIAAVCFFPAVIVSEKELANWKTAMRERKSRMTELLELTTQKPFLEIRVVSAHFNFTSDSKR